ncbi:hypothetical protein [Pleionea sp. CnH1-48]|uniref:hypothetical protein n=1 Tax=Pleionea sp. CnH1-48 TaxID=2954494 RepID=UPI0020969332|nr:hypothetical protein [Pleionea sp. CnH1-48]MCO7226959.1 hypothetical protein [Pleionea sp. CnH1-48]
MDKELEYESVLKVLLLCVFTAGFYLFYKLFKLSSFTNSHSYSKISKVFMFSVSLMFLVSMLSLAWGVLHLPDTQIIKAHLPILPVSSILDIIWIVRVRNALNMAFRSSKHQGKLLHPLLTSAFHIVYIQYVLNKR